MDLDLPLVDEKGKHIVAHDTRPSGPYRTYTDVKGKIWYFAAKTGEDDPLDVIKRDAAEQKLRSQDEAERRAKAEAAKKAAAAANGSSLDRFHQQIKDHVAAHPLDSIVKGNASAQVAVNGQKVVGGSVGTDCEESNLLKGKAGDWKFWGHEEEREKEVAPGVRVSVKVGAEACLDVEGGQDRLATEGAAVGEQIARGVNQRLNARLQANPETATPTPPATDGNDD